MNVYTPRCSVSPSPLLKQAKNKASDTGLNIHFYPNPVTNQAILSWDVDSPIDQYQLFDSKGLLVLEQKISSTTASTMVNMEFLPQGIYMLKLSSNKTQIKTCKLIKK